VITDHLKATYTVCIICFILHFPYRLIEYWWHECKWSLNLNYALCPVIQSSISLFISIVLWCVYKAVFLYFFIMAIWFWLHAWNFSRKQTIEHYFLAITCEYAKLLERCLFNHLWLNCQLCGKILCIKKCLGNV